MPSKQRRQGKRASELAEIRKIIRGWEQPGRSNRVQVFDRRDIAEILGISPALVRNWSLEKPYKITPSLRAPGRRGASNLYRIEDVYLFKVAKLLSWSLRPQLVQMALKWLQENPQYLEQRNRKQRLIIHLWDTGVRDESTGKEKLDALGLSYYTASKLPKLLKDMVPGYYFDLRGALREVDLRVDRWEAVRLYERVTKLKGSQTSAEAL